MNVILSGHGNVGTSMKESVEMIFGTVDKFYPVEFHKGEGTEDLIRKYKNIINENEEETIIIADLFCGSPYNAASIIAIENDSVEVISGMSLPICLDIATMYNSSNSKEIIEHVKKSVQEYTKSFREQLILESEDDL